MNTPPPVSFELLETLALVDGQLRHAALHLARMAASATHFGWHWDADPAQVALAQLQAAHPTGAWRVRLLMHPAASAANGGNSEAPKPVFEAQAFALPPTVASEAQPLRLQLAQRPLAEAHTDWVAHKTTWRAHYDAFTPTDPAVFDTLLYNPQGEVTECTRGNVAAWLDGRWVTPHLRCGLLPGIGRAVALQQGRLVEQVIPLADVPRIGAWAFLNSLRGWLPARLVGGTQSPSP
jgi:para-aminobenzoate synthetase/4-amino-4-deoxychorismate lyase